MPSARLDTPTTPAPDVSIIVPVRNGGTAIQRCVTSLLDLVPPPGEFEILVVDNQSSDSTMETLRAFGASIRVFEEPARGAGAARNCGLRHARGQLIAFIDADCTADREWVTALTSRLSDPTVGVAGGRILSRPAGNAVERYGEHLHDHRRAIEEERPPYAISMNWASRLSVLREAGGFDETFLRGQDVDLSWRLVQRGYRLVYADDAVVYHENERTLRGLLHEGFVHGRAAVRLRDRHADLLPRGGRPYVSIPRRLLRHVRQLTSIRRRTEVLDALFNLGKIAGELLPAKGRTR